jgi:hypothetical protein
MFFFNISQLSLMALICGCLFVDLWPSNRMSLTCFVNACFSSCLYDCLSEYPRLLPFVGMIVTLLVHMHCDV